MAELNPLSKVGLILANISAGMKGQPLPSQIFLAQQDKEREMQIRQLQATMGLVKNGVELFGDVENRDESPEYASFLAKGEKAIPGFGDMMNLAFSHKKEDVLAGHEHAKRIHQICGMDGDCFQKVMTNSSLMDQFNTTADLERVPTIRKKFQLLSDAVGGDEKLKSIMGPDGKWSLGDLTLLPKGFAFTEEEIRTIARNPEIQSQMIEFGFEPASVALKRAEEKPSALEEKVGMLEEIGVPHDIAVKTAADVYERATDAFGRVTIVDPTTREQIWPQESGAAPAKPEQEVVQTGAEATGGQAVFDKAVNKITDFFGAGLQFEDSETAINNLNDMSAITLLRLSRAMATRDTNMVRTIIGEMLPKAATFKAGDAGTLSKIKSMRDQLQIMLNDEQEVVDNKMNYPPKMVADATASVKNLKSIIDMWSGVIDNWNKKPAERGKGKESKYKEGDTIINRETGERRIFKDGKWQKM